MTSGARLDPELESLVEEARQRARAAGELIDEPLPPLEPLSKQAQQALQGWVASGDYDLAVAEVVGDDPELATQ